MKSVLLAVILFLMVAGFLPSISKAQSPTEYEVTMNYLGLDLRCQPICWHNFEPMVTPVNQVFDAFGTSYPIYKKDLYVPESYVGGITGPIGLYAFSDDTQPIPLLRTYLVDISMRTGSNRRWTLTETERQQWFFATIITEYGLPTQLGFEVSIYGVTESEYILTLDYDSLNVTFMYSGELTDRDNNPKVCPDSDLGHIQLWIYSDQETDGLTMRHDLERYEHYNIPFSGPFPELQVLTDLPKIAKLITEFGETECLDIEHLPEVKIHTN